VPFVFYAQSAEARANLRWTLLDFGKTSSSVEAAVERSEEARQALETERANTSETAASLFLQIIHDDRLVDARKTSLKNRQRYAIFAKALVERGIKSGIDDLRARVAVESAKTELLRAESKALEDRVRLGALLGVPLARLQNLVKVAIPSPTDLESPEKAAAVALATRSEVKGAEADVRARDALVGAARAQYLPTVSLSLDAAYKQSNFDVVDGLVPRLEGTGGVVLSFPIVDPHVWTNVRVAELDAALSRGQLARVKQSIGVEAQAAAIELQSARALLSRAKEQAAAAEGALLVIEARYQSGVSNPLELVDAETNDTDAREGVAAAQLKVDLAALSLAMATNRDAPLRK
jgi:multidrug efflux system outer membrane protein